MDKDTNKLAADCINDILDANFKAAFFVGLTNDNHVSLALGDDPNETSLAAILASAMTEHEDIKDLILSAVVMFAKEQGTCAEIQLPTDPNLN